MRFGSLARSLPKQLMPVANRPILDYAIDQLVNAGIRDIGVVISPKTGHQIRDALTRNSPSVDCTFIVQERPLGLAHGVLVAREFLADEPFLLYLGDNLMGGDLESFVNVFQSASPDALVLLKPVGDPRRFGVAELNRQGDILRLIEKPSRPTSDLALVGIYAFSPAVHDVIAALEPSERGELEITHALQALIDRGAIVRHMPLNSWWIDVGRAGDLLEANRLVLGALIGTDVQGFIDEESRVSGCIHLAPGSCVTRCRLTGPVAIGSGTRITDSIIGPATSIGRDCEIVQAHIAGSVVLDGASIEGARFENRVVASSEEIVGDDRAERGERLVLYEGGRSQLR